MTEHNKLILKEWLQKADGDFEAAVILYKSKNKKKLLYVIAFHCQQAIEKYIKTLLVAHNVYFPKTHDLLLLLDLLSEKDPMLSGLRSDLIAINPYAISFRYPGEDIDSKETSNAVTITKRTRKVLLKRISDFL